MAKIVYRIVSGRGEHTPQFDEQLRLIQAVDKKEAFDKAQRLGVQDEFSFTNERHEKVVWTFVNVAELRKLPALADGTELHSRLLETDDAKALIDITDKKAEQIRLSTVALTKELI